MKPVQELFSIYAEQLPENWKWATVYFMFGEGVTEHFSEYGLSEDRTLVEKDFSSSGLGVSQIFHDLKDEIAPPPLEQPTHIELTIQPDGKFDTVLGYGEPNWDIAPRAWPDDITATDYTYTKAWPNGMSDDAKSIMEDPRSLIGYD